MIYGYYTIILLAYDSIWNMVCQEDKIISGDKQASIKDKSYSLKHHIIVKLLTFILKYFI
jgi:hypothetical protein